MRTRRSSRQADGTADGVSTAPAHEPEVVPSPPTQTQQDVQTRNVDKDTVDSWLEMDANGDVTVYSGKVELGTGITTALTQIVAEELGVPFDRLDVVMGDTALTPDQGTTAGSKSIQVAGPVLRQAAAEARLVLLARASAQLGVPVNDLMISDGVVTCVHEASKAIAIGELAGDPFSRGVTPFDPGLWPGRTQGPPLRAGSDAPTKPPSAHAVVGQSLPRVDLLAKLTGADAYVQDVRLEGMLHGRVIRPYVRAMDGVGATIERVDDSDARIMPGVVQVVRNGDFLGVVAEREEQAIRAAEAIGVTWSTPDRLPSLEGYHDQMRGMVSEDGQIVCTGDVDDALGRASRTLEATYRFPFQAHASMAPSCAVADVRADGATIYTSTQNVYGLRAAISPVLGMGKERIRIIFREGSGCYGHNGADDVTADAALLSQAAGRPVRVQWMRRDEFAWEPKGPAMTMDVRAGLDEEGNLTAWDYNVWTPTHSTRPGGQPGNLLAGQQIDPPVEPATLRYVGGDRNAPTTYTFPNNRVTVHWVKDAPLRPSALRSLGGLHNTTANELFLDEVAAAAGADPVEYRLRYQTDPRAVDVIQAAAEAAGWNTQASDRKPAVSGGLLRGRGFAYARYETEYTYVATVAEVEVDPGSGEVRVTRVVVAHDCGLVVNPDGVRNQIEGNVIQGISRALKEQVTWDEHAVTSLTWETYHILTFPEVPSIEVVLINRPEEPAFGAGEPAICTVPPAIGNAVFDATGVRLRTLPFTPERVRQAMPPHPGRWRAERC